MATLEKINHIVSPSELYVGYGLIILEQANQPPWTARANLEQGETMLELAVKGDTDPWSVAQINGLAEPSGGLPGDTLYLPAGNSEAAPSGLPAALVSAQVDPLPLVQGSTAQIEVVSSQPVTLGGLLVDHPLHFYPTDTNTQVALQGVYGGLDPGYIRYGLTSPGQTGRSSRSNKWYWSVPGIFPPTRPWKWTLPRSTRQ